jgi:hypothetical protein
MHQPAQRFQEVQELIVHIVQPWLHLAQRLMNILGQVLTLDCFHFADPGQLLVEVLVPELVICLGPQIVFWLKNTLEIKEERLL